MKARKAVAHIGSPDDGYSIEFYELPEDVALFKIKKWLDGECVSFQLEADRLDEVDLKEGWDAARRFQFPGGLKANGDAVAGE